MQEILQSIGIYKTKVKKKKKKKKKKKLRMVAYTCRYSSGHLIPIPQSIAIAELKRLDSL